MKEQLCLPDLSKDGSRSVTEFWRMEGGIFQKVNDPNGKVFCFYLKDRRRFVYPVYSGGIISRTQANVRDIPFPEEFVRILRLEDIPGETLDWEGK